MLFHYTENLSQNGTASQSSTYHWISRQLNLTSDLAITGGRTHSFISKSCALTLYSPTQYTAWWMLTFPVDTVYITKVLIYFRGGSKFFFSYVPFNFVVSSYWVAWYNIIHSNFNVYILNHKSMMEILYMYTSMLNTGNCKSYYLENALYRHWLRCIYLNKREPEWPWRLAVINCLNNSNLPLFSDQYHSPCSHNTIWYR